MIENRNIGTEGGRYNENPGTYIEKAEIVNFHFHGGLGNLTR